MGVLGRADYKWMLANVARQWTTPGSWYRCIFLSLGAQTQFNYENDRTDLDYHSGFNAQLKNYWNTGIFAIVRPSYLDETADARRSDRDALRIQVPRCKPERRPAQEARMGNEPQPERRHRQPGGEARRVLPIVDDQADDVAEHLHRAGMGPRFHFAAVRYVRERSGDACRLRRHAVRVWEAGAEDVLGRHARKRDVHAEFVTRAVRAAVPGERALHELQGIRETKVTGHDILRARQRKHRGCELVLRMARLRIPSIRTATEWPRRSRSAIRTSTFGRCAVPRCCDGSTARARRCSSCGPSSGKGSTISATSSSAAIGRRCSAIARLTSSR